MKKLFLLLFASVLPGFAQPSNMMLLNAGGAGISAPTGGGKPIQTNYADGASVSSVTLPFAATAGNTIIGTAWFAVSPLGATFYTVTINGVSSADTCTGISASTLNWGGFTQQNFICSNISGGTAYQINVGYGSGGGVPTFNGIYISEYAGVTTVGVSATNSGSNGATMSLVSPLSPNANNQLVYAAGVVSTANSLYSATAPMFLRWPGISSGAIGDYTGVADDVQTTATAVQNFFTTNATSAWGLTVTTFNTQSWTTSIPFVSSSIGYGTTTAQLAHTTNSFAINTGATQALLFIGTHYLWPSTGCPSACSGTATAISTVTDTAGNVWQLLEGPANYAGATFPMMAAVYVCVNPIASGSDTITVTLSNSTPLVMHLYVVSGGYGSPVVSAIANPGSPGTTNNTSTSNAIPVAPNSLVLQWVKTELPSGPTSSGFTMDWGQVSGDTATPASVLWPSDAPSISGGSTTGVYTWPSSSAAGWQSVIFSISANTVAPTFLSLRGMPSTEGNAVGTKTNNTCATKAYCTQLVDPSLAGNTLLAFVTYANASSNPPTVTDDKGNTWARCSSESVGANTRFADIYYVVNAVTGTRAITTTWTAAVTQAAVAVAQVYNVTQEDVCAANNGTAATTFSSGSATSSAAGDLWFELACGTSTATNVGAWTAGSQTGITWTMDLADRRDACAIQHGVQTASGALNPQLTTATTNNYVAVGISLKTGAQGTAPTGMYVKHLYSVSSATGVSGSLAYQVPVSGNLIAGALVGGALIPTGISDTTNGSWKTCGPVNNGDGIQTSSAFYAANATPGLLATTIATSGTGDIGAAAFYDIAGAATTQVCGYASPQAYVSATAATFTPMSGFVPSSSAGLILYSTGYDFNTAVSINSPSSGYFDANTYGSESLSGPEPVDQNNGLGHFANSSNAANSLTWNVTSSSTAIELANTTIAAFQASGATLYPAEVNRAAVSASSSGTTIALTSYAPFQAGDVLSIIACTTATSGTIAISDSLGTHNTYTAVDGPTNLNGVRCATFYATGASGSTGTITATFGTTSTFRTIMLEEVANATTLDKHNLVATTASGNVLTGTSVTTTSANEVLTGFALCSQCNLVANEINSGKSTSPWTQLNNDGGGNVSGFLATGATGTFAVNFIDEGGASASDVTAILTFH